MDEITNHQCRAMASSSPPTSSPSALLLRGNASSRVPSHLTGALLPAIDRIIPGRLRDRWKTLYAATRRQGSSTSSTDDPYTRTHTRLAPPSHLHPPSPLRRRPRMQETIQRLHHVLSSSIPVLSSTVQTRAESRPWDLLRPFWTS